VTHEIDELIQRREVARKSGDFGEADRIREQLRRDYGVVIKDTPQGVSWHHV
jgi:cysteinyl-tRNA synthetase